MSTRVQFTSVPQYKIVLLGCGGVGKSALITQLVKGIFLKRYDPTIEDSYKKEIVVDGTTCILEVLDTAGTISFDSLKRQEHSRSFIRCYGVKQKNMIIQIEQFTAMRDLYMKNGDGFIVVYSITDASSLTNTAEIFQSLLRVRQKYHFPLILVGNKCDDIKNREVSRSDGEQYAARYNSTFCEASAKNNIHVIEIFEDIVKQIRIEGQLTVHQSEKERKRWYADNGRSMCCFI